MPRQPQLIRARLKKDAGPFKAGETIKATADELEAHGLKPGDWESRGSYTDPGRNRSSFVEAQEQSEREAAEAGVEDELEAEEIDQLEAERQADEGEPDDINQSVIEDE